MSRGKIEEIVMTPLVPPDGTKVMKIERVAKDSLNPNEVQHFAGGPYKGIVINKAAQRETPSTKSPDQDRSFTAIVVDTNNESYREKRTIKFWFINTAKVSTEVMTAITDTFFKELMKDFPKNYIQSVKKTLNQMKAYDSIKKLELHIKTIRAGEEPENINVREQVTRTRVTTTTTKTVKTRIGEGGVNGGVGQDDFFKLADGTYISAHGFLICQDGETIISTANGRIYRLPPTTPNKYYRLLNGQAVAASDYELQPDENSVKAPNGEILQLATGGASQENFYVLADGTTVDAVDFELEPDGMTIKSTKDGAVLQLMPPKFNPSYYRLVDGTIVSAEGYELLADGETIRSMQDDVEFKLAPSSRPGVECIEKVYRLSDGRSIDAHGFVVSNDESKLIQIVDGAEFTLAPGGVSQDDYYRLADGNTVHAYGYILAADGETVVSTKQGHVLKLPMRGQSQENFYHLADGTVVSAHGFIMNDDGDTIVAPTTGQVLQLAPRGQEDYIANHAISQQFGGTYLATYSATMTVPSGGSHARPQSTLTRRGLAIVQVSKKQRLLNLLEDAYPNVLSVDDLVRQSEMSRADTEFLLEDMRKRGLLQEVDKGRWIRMQVQKPIMTMPRKKRGPNENGEMEPERPRRPIKPHEFKMVAHIPQLPAHEQPTIAIVTLLFSEKLAVDAMMDTKTTYIRYKTEGEGQVYTIGVIGKHRVVSTKLARITGKGATVAAGNSITRLLGTFSRVEHVVLVGVGGGVANKEDDSKHARLGDIVMSKPAYDGGPVYVHTDRLLQGGQGKEFNVQMYAPKLDTLLCCAEKIEEKTRKSFIGLDWEKYMTEALDELEGGEQRFSRPSPDSDKLYKLVEGQEVPMEHPMSPTGTFRAINPNQPCVHYGVVGSGKILSKDDSLRQEFAQMNDVKIIDSGFQAVMESIEGNKNDSFAVIRAVADYHDGTVKREWQNYAALAAAAYMKALILRIDKQDADSDED